MAVMAGRALARAHGSGFDLCLTGRPKVVGREARDLAVAASFGGGSKLWRHQQALETAVSFGGGSNLWMRQQACYSEAANSMGSKL